MIKKKNSIHSFSHSSLICRLLSFVIALTFFVFPIPDAMAKKGDYFEKYPEMDEIPYSYPIESGDLNPEELEKAVLNPTCIWDFLLSEAELLNHVNRLYEQEPDDYTVIYQNKDGSKTVYVFSCRVKENGQDIPEESFKSEENIFLIENNRLTVKNNNCVIDRITNHENEKALNSYNIGFAAIRSAGEDSSIADITERFRKLTDARETCGFSIELSEEESRIISAGSPIMYLAYTYSDLAGIFCLKNEDTLRYLTINTNSQLLQMGTTQPRSILSEFVFSYIADCNSSLTPHYEICPLYRYYKYVSYTSEYSSVNIDIQTGNYYRWKIELYSTDVICIKAYDNSSYAIDSTPGLGCESDTEDGFDDDCFWRLTNHRSFVRLEELNLPNAICMYTQEDIQELFLNVEPYNCTDYEISWYNYEDDTMLESDDGYDIDYPTFYESGNYTVYCYDEYSDITSGPMCITVSEFEDFGTNTNKTYAIRPYYVSSPGFYDNYLTMDDDISGNSNQISIEAYSNSAIAYSAKWVDKSQIFTISRIDGTQTNKIAATLCANQYSANGNQVPTYTWQGSVESSNNNYNNSDWSAYHMVYQSDVPNYITKNGNTVVGSNINSSGNDWMLFRTGTATYGTVTAPTYVIGRYETDNGVKVFKALSHSNVNSGTQYINICSYYDSEIFDWTINEIGINVPLIKQTQTTYCGFTTLLQIMYGAGTADFLSTSSQISDRINSVFDNNHARGEVYGGYMSQWTICSLLNDSDHFSDGSFDYNHYQYCRTSGQSYSNFKTNQETNTKEKFVDLINNSINNGWRPFFLTDNGDFKIENGGNPHYVCICGYDAISDTVLISNCHYCDGTYDKYPYGIFAYDAGYLYNRIQTMFYSEVN